MKTELGRTAIHELLAELVSDPGRWRDCVRHDPERRVFVQIAGDESFEAWLICWMPGHDTGFHDHDLSSGAVTVIEGEVVEDRLNLGSPPSQQRYGAGDTLEFTPADIHRVRHAGEEPATTLHVYSPRLRRMGAYRVDEGGALAREPVASSDELRPLEPQRSLDG